MTIRLPLRTSWPKTQSSSAKALYIVPDKRLQSPDEIASRTNCKVWTFSDARSTSWAVIAAGIASLAMLKAYSLVSTASWCSCGPTGRRLRASAEFSFPAICLTT